MVAGNEILKYTSCPPSLLLNVLISCGNLKLESMTWSLLNFFSNKYLPQSCKILSKPSLWSDNVAIINCSKLIFTVNDVNVLPPDSRTGSQWGPWSSPGDPEDPAPIDRSGRSCAGADGHRTWRSAAPPAEGLAHSPPPWQGPREHREEGEEELIHT